jgi:hypothetical protein
MYENKAKSSVDAYLIKVAIDQQKCAEAKYAEAQRYAQTLPGTIGNTNWGYGAASGCFDAGRQAGNRLGSIQGAEIKPVTVRDAIDSEIRWFESQVRAAQERLSTAKVKKEKFAAILDVEMGELSSIQSYIA